ncbi:hypothetical protein [Aeromicrobium sp.]|uniref:SCO7613 C-terminal domain-containing membrane protein n=1 Tax=Aeromicrobium sp. TaxID=1871063 RepID=UPI0019A230DE|nr:hypothetical protein [Aeromicrobium sp.]MBC7633235.1 hypothetical protein [Aeromicrobium sp.]
MRFADPKACPDCRGAIDGDSQCPHCGLNLTSAEVRELWQVLLHADALLARATRAPLPACVPAWAPMAPPPAPAAPTATSAPAGRPASGMGQTVVPPVAPQASSAAPFPSYPASQPLPHPTTERRWSVGTILVTLGAFGLIVAGFIFVTGSWGDLGLVGRTLILSGVTAVLAALGVWVTLRPLRASAEAVWTIVLTLLTIDFFAARHEGMLGLDGLEMAWSWAIWGTFVLGVAAAITLWARRTLKADLVATSLVGGLGITIAAIGAGNIGDGWDMSWRSCVALVVAGALALATRPAAIRVLTIASRVVVAGFYLFAFVAAAVELFDHPALDDVVAGRHGLPMALIAVASVAVGAVVRQVRIPAVAAAVVSATLLVVTPASEESQTEGLWLAVAVIAAALAVGAVRGSNDWLRGVRVGAVPSIAALLLLQVVLLIDVLDSAGHALDTAWDGAWDARLDSSIPDDVSTWVVPAVLVALLVVCWFVPRWPEAATRRPHAYAIAAIAASVGLANAVVAARVPVWAGVALLLAAAAALLVARLRGPQLLVGGVPLAGPLSALFVVLAAALAASSTGVSAPAWLAGAAVLAVLAHAKDGPRELRLAYAGAGAGLAIGGVAAAARLLDVPEQAVAVAVLVTGLGLVAGAGLPLRDHVTRIPLEVVGVLAAAATLTDDVSSSELAVRWTLLGVVLIALSFAVPDRRWYLWPGISAMIVAYVLLIVDSGFTFVEAYTLPLGAAALGLGIVLLRRHTASGTWLYLGPGLALALLPSVPQALVDPTDLRALLLGAASLVALVAGVRLGWQAPFVSGVAILTLLVLFNIGPYANAAPRVVLIALVGAISLGIGITWEDRVRDGRRVVGYVRAMR